MPATPSVTTSKTTRHPDPHRPVITPGIERFEYFRHVVRLRAGTEPREILLGLQDRFDTHFVESPAWHGARAS